MALKPQAPITASPSQLTVNADQAGLHSFGHHPDPFAAYAVPPPQLSPSNPRKRRASNQLAPNALPAGLGQPHQLDDPQAFSGVPAELEQQQSVGPPPTSSPPVAKKGRTNTPWTAAEEQRLKQMRDAGASWSEIAKTFPTRTEGSVKKHWYKDMHYAEFAEDESAALLAAIKEYEASKWKVIGAKVGKPAKACEQYAKEHFGGKI